MGDMGDIFRDMKDWNRMVRAQFGVPCPRCQQEQPLRQPTVMLPGRQCKVHRPPYRDPRPQLTQADYDTLCQDTPA